MKKAILDNLFTIIGLVILNVVGWLLLIFLQVKKGTVLGTEMWQAILVCSACTIGSGLIAFNEIRQSRK